MGNMKDISGQKFGKWTVLECAGKNKYGAYMWRCVCECGAERVVAGSTLRRGVSTGCGCTRGLNNHGNFVHGGRGERLYRIWRGMRTRCFNSNDHAYELYGGRGITICEEWSDYAEFRKWASSSGYDPNVFGHEQSIDRIDNDGPYAPWNCRWVTQIAQCNNRRSNHRFTANGVTHTITEWSRITGIRKDTLRRRVFVLGWEPERAITEPVHRK